MPSTVVHVALTGIIACALLGPAFSGRSLLVVLGVTALVDLDVFLGFVSVGAHRAAFHSILFPAVVGAPVYYDRVSAGPARLRERFGEHAHRVGFVAVIGVAFGAIGPDLVTNGVNLFWPLHDQFYALTGKVHISDTEGLVQTFVDFSDSEPTRSVARGSTSETQYHTGVDVNPDRAGEPDIEERIFPIVDTGEQLLLVVTSVFVMGSRLWEERTTQAGRD